MTFIFSIIASLVATAVGAAGAWLYNRKKQSDATINQINRIMNDISAVKDQMTNGFERIALEKEAVLSAFDSTKKDLEQSNKEFYQSIVDRLQAETQKHEDLRERVDQNIRDTATQMSKNTDLVKSAVDVISQVSEDIRKSKNLPPQ